MVVSMKHIFQGVLSSVSHELRVHLTGTGITFQTSSDSHWKWALYYLGPFCNIDNEIVPHEPQLISTDSPELYSEVLQSLADTKPRPTTLYSQQAAYEYAVDDSLSVFRHAATNGLVIINWSDAQILCLANPRDPSHHYLPTRTIRELLYRHLETKGFVSLHASGVVSEEGATLFVGAKGSGKTTLSLIALAENNTHFMSNDRVYVGPDYGDAKSGLVAVGWPSTVYASIQTIRLFPQLSGILDGSVPLVFIQQEDIASILEQRLWSGNREYLQAKIDITAREIETLFLTKTCSVAPLRRVVLPHIREDLDRPIVGEQQSSSMVSTILSHQRNLSDNNSSEWPSLQRLMPTSASTLVGRLSGGLARKVFTLDAPPEYPKQLDALRLLFSES